MKPVNCGMLVKKEGNGPRGEMLMLKHHPLPAGESFTPIVTHFTICREMREAWWSVGNGRSPKGWRAVDGSSFVKRLLHRVGKERCLSDDVLQLYFRSENMSIIQSSDKRERLREKDVQ